MKIGSIYRGNYEKYETIVEGGGGGFELKIFFLWQKV